MSNEHELASFCFRCSAKDPRYDPTERTPDHNPWPMLALQHAPEYMRSQPLIRACYMPSPFGQLAAIPQRRAEARSSQLTQQDRADFLDWCNFLHEYVHLWHLDWTPAKEVAKIYLATSYALLHMLLFDEELPDYAAEAAWERFQRATIVLARIAQKIGFVEELFATAIALRIMEEQFQPGGMWVGFEFELETITAQALQQEEAVFPGFTKQYQRIAPLVEIMRDPTIGAGMTPLLQPITHPDNSDSMALDALENLNRILELLDDGDRLEVTAQRLRPLAQQLAADWRLALSLQIDWAHTPLIEKGGRKIVQGQFAQYLWKISRGSYDATLEGTQASFHFLDAFQKGQWLGSNVFILERKTQRRRHFLDGKWLPVINTPIPEDIQNAHVEVLFFEGVRQQILMGTGFVCPLSKGATRCRCSRTRYNALMRLSAYAAAGLFGSGKWSPLPCKPR